MASVPVTHLKPAQWSILKGLVHRVDSGERLDLESWARRTGSDIADFRELADLGLIAFAGPFPRELKGEATVEATDAGRNLTTVWIDPCVGVLVSCAVRPGGMNRIGDVRRMVSTYTLLTHLFRHGLLEIADSETGEARPHRPSWEEVMQFGGYDQGALRVRITRLGRPYAQAI